MAQNPVLNDFEERIYPMVTGAVSHIKGFFGWGGNEDCSNLDRLDTQRGRSSTGSCSGSGTAVSCSYGGIDPFHHSPVRNPSSPAKYQSISASSSPARTSSPARGSVGSGSVGLGGCPPDGTSSLITCTQSSNHVLPSRTGSVNNDICRAKKSPLVEGPLRAFSFDVTTKNDTNHLSNSSPLRQPTSATSSPLRQSASSTSSPLRQTASATSSPLRRHASSTSSSPARQPTSTSSVDFEQLSVCAEDLEEPDCSSSEKLGRLQFSVRYDFDAQTLTIKIIKAEELAAKDLSGTSDPYVKISLLPDKKHTLTTNIKRKNLNPRWNEVFAFEGFPYNKVITKTLHLLVIDYDRFSRDDPIGEVCLQLGDLDLATGPVMWKNLQPCKGSVGKLGMLLLSLCYQPTVGCITVVICKARDLKAKDINGLSDPYVKIWLMHDGKKMEKKKTEVKEKNLNPVFNETFVFTVPYERIRTTSLIISVMDYDRMGRNEAIGQIVLGTKSGVMEMKHWNEMFAKSRQPVSQWHILKDFD